MNTDMTRINNKKEEFVFKFIKIEINEIKKNILILLLYFVFKK